MAATRSIVALAEGTDTDARDLEASRGELLLTLDLRHVGRTRLRLSYELVGSQGPLLIVCGGISAGRHVISSKTYPEPGWWEAQRQPLTRYPACILSIDWIGADGKLDRPIDPADQATAIHHLLEALGRSRCDAFLGSSYGAMVGMQLAARHPDAIGRLLAISGAGRTHPFSSACRALQRRVITLAEASGQAASGVSLARAMAMLTYRTPDEFAERFNAAPAVCDGIVRVAAEDYLEAHGVRHCQRMASTAYRRLSESIDLHQVAPSDLQVPVTFVAVDSDALVPARDIRELADAVLEARFHLIRSRFGHDAFLKEQRKIARIVTLFLSFLELSK